jgi:two-component system chemotaxis sensor kinase CheA
MSRYLDLFLAEAREHLGAVHVIQSRLEQTPVASGLWPDFMRHAHSLKGMAAAMRFGSMVSLTHAVEALAERLAKAPAEASREYLPLLGESLACLGNLLDRIERGEDAACPRAEDLARALESEAGSAPQGASPRADASTSADTVGSTERPEERSYWRLDLSLSCDADDSAQRTVAILGRVGELGRVVQSGPPSFARSTGRFHGRVRLTLQTDRARAELERELRSLPGLRSFTLETAPRPESPPDPAEGPADWIRVRADRLDAMVERILELRQEHARLAVALPSATGRVRRHLERSEFRLKELYGAVLELRLLPFETVAQRLHQAVHDLAGELRKQVHFEIAGGDALLDRAVLEALVDPLLHALKNALDHGLESPAERRAAGKPVRGALRLSLTRTGDRVHIVVADDGRGMQPDLLRRAAVRHRVLSREDADELTDDETLLLTTLPRFTTRLDADHISGRGVGLDVVRERVESIGGFIDIRSEPGRGCELLISVPLRRALIRTLLVRCANELFAVPVDGIAKSVELVGPGAAPATGEAHLELIRLRDQLDLDPAEPAPSTRARALVLASVEPPTALVVDEVLGRRDLVVQPLLAPLTHLREYSGAALLEDGSIAVVLDPRFLARGDGIRRGACRPSCGSAP